MLPFHCVKQEVLPPGQDFSADELAQEVTVLQLLHVSAHDPDTLRSTITNEAFILNDNVQLCIHESNLQAFNMSFILKIRANTILIRKMIHFCLAG